MLRLALLVCGVFLLSLPAAAGDKPPHHLGSPLRNLGLESTSLLGGIGDLLRFTTSESRQGQTDLDGDGDTTGRIFFIYDGKRGKALNTKVDFADGGFFGGDDPGVLYLATEEFFLGGDDVNGDGDLFDNVFHVYDQKKGRLWNTGLIADGGVKWRRQVFMPDPSLLAPGCNVFDLDSGEGGPLGFNFSWMEVVEDDILVDRPGAPPTGWERYEPDTGALVPLGIGPPGVGNACDRPFDAGHWAVFACRESHVVDLNGDGDAVDEVPVLYEAGTGLVSTINVALAFLPSPDQRLLVSNGWAALAAFEAASGAQDFNGDGDLTDKILFTIRFDRDSYEVTNTRQAVGNRFWHEGPLNLFDRGAPTFVLVVLDAEREEMTELGGGIAFTEVQVSSELVVFPVDEEAPVDLNGDGDSRDDVLHYFERRRRGIVNTELESFSSFGVEVAGQWIAIETRDCKPASLAGITQGCTVLIDTHARRNIVHRLPATSDMHLSESLFAVETPERSGAFSMDLNGDGDTIDQVLFLMELPGRHGPAH